jgi:hypothetical protein
MSSRIKCKIKYSRRTKPSRTKKPSFFHLRFTLLVFKRNCDGRWLSAGFLSTDFNEIIDNCDKAGSYQGRYK